MEKRDLELIQELAKSNWELRTLHKSHLQFQEELAALERRPFLTPSDELRRKDLQKLKLAGRDRMETICTEHRRHVEKRKRRTASGGPPDLTA